MCKTETYKTLMRDIKEMNKSRDIPYSWTRRFNLFKSQFSLFDINCSSILLYLPPRVMKIKTNINKWDLTKLKCFCTAKETINKMTINPQNGRKYLQTKQLTKDSSPKFTSSSCSSISKTQKMGRRLKQTSPKKIYRLPTNT